ncbi:MAG: exodeoxyribonuclease VII large subunit [Blastocatellia bacterium]|nr:exodeoxyribonuclease VII large subunit [Blastocatellia bacterium]MCS7157851.1 exodeoxyribonuclease VII large subunit [Blastocatellia bacterium]MCX7753412.1 exodeoxyribonuclease VII large subunit [Blastocatellia bacterium]MDW8168071.1 exodeoxyribonuclease VII large subunit [Acidobacteriota bacterium]MDW8257680.1 exodeoxyribonuclease VII large subunit [Acidobacteriota bacterium]
MESTILAKLTAERQAFTVSELTSRIRDLLEGEFPDVWVRGEISNFKSHSSGHWYFTLKDAVAQLPCVCFRSQNRLIRFQLEDGLEVYARGRLSVFEKRGEYRLLVAYMEPVGIGSLQLAFEQLKARLAAEGLFDPARKRPLPLMPRKIGVITSPTGAAIRDILRILKRRNRGIDVLIFPVRVQGEGAAEEIAAAIRLMNQRDDLDVLIVGRGGGSIEDLWAFNEEIVARAIFHSRIPIISAVGHETDFTIADFVADVRAPTPSAAAEMVAARRDELIERFAALESRAVKAARYLLARWRERLLQLRARPGFLRVRTAVQHARQRADELDYQLQIAMTRRVRATRERFAALSMRLTAQRPSRRLAEIHGRLAVLRNRLEATIRERLHMCRRRLSLAVGKLDALSPLAVLSRGYAIVWNERHVIVRDVAEVRVGERLRVRLFKGRLTAVTEEVELDE